MLIDAGDSLLAFLSDRVMLLRKGNSLQKLRYAHFRDILVHVLRFSRALFQRQQFDKMRDASDTNHSAGAKNAINLFGGCVHGGKLTADNRFKGPTMFRDCARCT